MAVRSLMISAEASSDDSVYSFRIRKLAECLSEHSIETDILNMAEHALLSKITTSPLFVPPWFKTLRGYDFICTAAEEAAHALFLTRPFLNWMAGIGINISHVAFERYLRPAYRYSWPYVVHVEYLYRLAETGIVGFILYYAIIVAMLVKLWRSLSTSSWWIFIEALGIFASMVGSFLHRFFSAYHYVNLYIFFCVLLALAVVVDRHRKDGIKAAYGAAEP